MRIYKEVITEEVEEPHLAMKATKTCFACLYSFLVSVAGGLLLVFWNYAYHPTNSQLWMVPFGLILLITPVIVWVAVFISGFISSNSTEKDVNGASQPVFPLEVSDLDPEK